MEDIQTEYKSWSPDKLVDRVMVLEQQLKELNEKLHYTSTSTPPKRSPRRIKSHRLERNFDASKYSTRLIALKFAYLGQRYNGYEHHANNKTPLPTIEEALWKALYKARLIYPGEPLSAGGEEINWEGCDYSKCGRTDRGVSAFGQVVGIRVRSNRPPSKKSSSSELHEAERSVTSEIELAKPPLHKLENAEDSETLISLEDPDLQESLSFDPIKDEIPYLQVLNRLLPSDIRIMAWCPAPPLDFSARFSCKERRYRYFFTQPAFVPTYEIKVAKQESSHDQNHVPQKKEGWLDIQAMKDGAKRFEGLHDFRNFCKVDASKQIENFERRIFHADIVEAGPEFEPAAFVRTPPFSESTNTDCPNGTFDDSTASTTRSPPKIYMFTVHGSGFLWHQVRHMVSILFLIGQGLESPSLVTKLLDIHNNPTKPMYEMAEDAPLVLWDCIFPQEKGDPHEDALDWIYIGGYRSSEPHDSVSSALAQKGGKFGSKGIIEGLWGLWRQKKMEEILAGTLLNMVASQGDNKVSVQEQEQGARAREDYKQVQKPISIPASQRIFAGGNEPRLGGKYVPVLNRPRMESVEVINARYATRKGFEQNEAVRDRGFRSVALRQV